MHRTTISLDDDVHNFILENNLSCSEILRMHIKELMSYADKSKAYVKELEGRLEKFGKQIEARRDFLTKKGLIDEFLQWQEQNK